MKTKNSVTEVKLPTSLDDFTVYFKHFLSEIQCACTRNVSCQSFWDSMTEHRCQSPIKSLNDFFATNFKLIQTNHTEKVINEINDVIGHLNKTDEVLTWKQGSNYLLKLIENDKYEPFYHRPECAAENFLP